MLRLSPTSVDFQNGLRINDYGEKVCIENCKMGNATLHV
jgi:hypothetical protein